jgi:hypothetical protein
MNYLERCEPLQHCQGVDKVVQAVPLFGIDAEFLAQWDIDYIIILAYDKVPHVGRVMFISVGELTNPAAPS